MLTVEQRDALIQAGLKGVRQIQGRLWDHHGGYCAVGWLQIRGLDDDGLSTPVTACDCGATTTWSGPCKDVVPIRTERDLIVHLNNDHGLDFIGIARKLGPPEE